MSRSHNRTRRQMVVELNTVLVPVDFSPMSLSVFARAQTIVGGENSVIILLHVIDPWPFGGDAAPRLGSPDLRRDMRSKAERTLSEMAASRNGEVTVARVVSEGDPSFEIVRNAEELNVDAVIIGTAGLRSDPMGFSLGATAERVVRACRRPVIVLYVEEGSMDEPQSKVYSITRSV